MKIHGMIYICPECRNFIAYTPHDNGTFNVVPLMCSDDGYMMKRIDIDDLMVDQLLKYGVPNASSETTGT